MLKRTMVCASFLWLAQSLTLVAQQDTSDGIEPAVEFADPSATVGAARRRAGNRPIAPVSDLPDVDDSSDVIAANDDAQFDDSEAQRAIDSKLTLNEQVQNLKQQMLELNKDLFILEEELLFPANTQIAVFLSMNVGYFFKLDAVKLTINGEVVTNYLYTARQIDALQRGGVQRLYLGNLKTGGHEIVAVFTGRGPQGRDYRRGATLRFDKTSQAKKVELKIVDSTASQQPEFLVKEW